MIIRCLLLFALSLFFNSSTLVAQDVLTQPGKPNIELLEEIDESERTTSVEQLNLPIEPTQAHECFGFNLIEAINSYSPPSMLRSPTEVFNSLEELQKAINAKADHDGAVFQLAGGVYNFTGTGIEINNRRNLTIYSDPSNRAVLDGQDSGNFGLLVKETVTGSTDNIEVMGFEVTRTRFHAIFVGSDSFGTTAGSDIYVANNYVHDAANKSGAGITIRNARGTGNVTVEGNEVTRIDMDGIGGGRGEGIYVGQGNNSAHYSQNVTIRGNYIHDLNGEAIDVKRASRDVLIEYNKANNISVFSQGAFALALDNLQPQDYQSDITVRRNIISNVKTLAFNGNAIVVAGDSIIEENLIFNVAKDAIDIYDDATGPNKKVVLRNNIVWNYGGQPFRENVETGNGGPHNPFSIERIENIVQSDPGQTDCQVVPDTFVGPLSKSDGFTPSSK